MTIDELVAMAATEGWRIRPPHLDRRPIAQEGRVVGFYCPHPAGRGRTRMGPIYVAPEWRGRGLAAQAYATDVPLVAYVHKDNWPSDRLHRKAGFTVARRTSHGTYWTRG